MCVSSFISSFEQIANLQGNAAKHFLNTPQSLVVESLEGLCAINPQLAIEPENKSVSRALPYLPSYSSCGTDR